MTLTIKYKIIEPYHTKKIPPGHCRICGAKLTDEKSIKRGVGKRCLANHVAVVLEIVPDVNPS